MTFQTSNNKKAKLLEAISKIISKNPKQIENIWQDLTKDKKNAGSKGLSADQVFRIALLKNIERLTYDQLVFILKKQWFIELFAILDLQIRFLLGHHLSWATPYSSTPGWWRAEPLEQFIIFWSPLLDLEDFDAKFIQKEICT